MARKRVRENDVDTSQPQQKKRATNPSVRLSTTIKVTIYMHCRQLTLQKVSQSTAQPQDYHLPPLPVIPDPAVAKAASLHQGALDAQTPLHASLERLEFLGDAYLGFLAAQTVHARYPQFTSGKLSQTKQFLVCNATLARFTTHYGLDKRAQLPEEIRIKEGTDSKFWTKILGDLFEAYVGGIIVSDPQHGYATVDTWMAELWEPLFTSEVEDEVVNRNAKQELATKIMTKGTRITYLDNGPPQKSSLKGRDIYSIKVCYTGLGYHDLSLGAGKGSNKAEAGYTAASQALRNPQLTEIMAKKKEHDLKSQAQKDRERKDTRGDVPAA
ncbi:MAG: hypothetical protein Q9172_006158 [Xanthocarpia lactea]